MRGAFYIDPRVDYFKKLHLQIALIMWYFSTTFLQRISHFFVYHSLDAFSISVSRTLSEIANKYHFMSKDH